MPGAPTADRARVILVNPKMCSRNSLRLPLSLLALAGALDKQRDCAIIDGNLDADAAGTVLRLIAEEGCALLGLTVMPGPQVAPAIAISRAVRERHPRVPIVWGGYFPTLYPNAAISAPYVDYVARGQGEETLIELLRRLPVEADGGRGHGGRAGRAGSAGNAGDAADVAGLTWKDAGTVVHNPDRAFRPPDAFPPYPYDRLRDVAAYLRPSFMGTRTAVHQAAVGCRFRCSFCGVVSMFNGYTRLPAAERLEQALRALRGYGANALQFYDHNFFDREEETVPLLEVLARQPMPWWCYARADALAGASPRVWQLIRRSRLRMTYVGAETASDDVLRSMRKGTVVDQTLEAAGRCREHGVIPELSFVLGGPEDPEEEIERTFRFIKRLKRVHPEADIVLYFYSPTPQRATPPPGTRPAAVRLPELETYGPGGPALPTTPEEWTAPRWIDYVCHRDAPWLTDQTRRRVRDFARVVSCRFPTVQDHATPRWGKGALRALSAWRYATSRYDSPWELELAQRLVRLREPQRESL